MPSVRFSPRAEQDLKDIWYSIAVDNENAADAHLLKLFDRLELAVTQPSMGFARRELSPTARILVHGRYLVIYEPAEAGIAIVAIVHGMRDPSTWLE